MKQILSIVLLFLSLNMQAEKTLKVTVSNPSNYSRTEYIVLRISQYGDVCSAKVTANHEEIPCQLDDLDQDEHFAPVRIKGLC